MALHIEERSDGGLALYIDGDFQFDSADEAIYHESLTLPALCLARGSRPEGMRVLICGGGDGLALRECVRFPGVSAVDLVDYDATVVQLARTRFAELNDGAFEDARVTVHFRDAWEFLNEAPCSAPERSEPAPAPREYDVIVCDFTVPRTQEQARVFTREWFEMLAARLAPAGIMAINGVSPQTTPEAFWCLDRTVHAARLSTLPYRVCIPSFRDHGYGAWAFILAARRPLPATVLRTLECPVETRLADMAQLWRGARFRRTERQAARRAPVHSSSGRAAAVPVRRGTWRPRARWRRCQEPTGWWTARAMSQMRPP